MNYRSRFRNVITFYRYVILCPTSKVDLILHEWKRCEADQMKQSHVLKQAIEKCCTIFGVPNKQVFPLKNYDGEIDNVQAWDIRESFTCLKLIHLTDDYIRKRLTGKPKMAFTWHDWIQFTDQVILYYPYISILIY